MKLKHVGIIVVSVLAMSSAAVSAAEGDESVTTTVNGGVIYFKRGGGKAACGQARPHFRGHARRAADAGARGAGAGLHIRPPARPRGGAGAA